MRWLGLVAVLSACGRIAFDPLDNAGGDPGDLEMTDFADCSQLILVPRAVCAGGELVVNEDDPVVEGAAWFATPYAIGPDTSFAIEIELVFDTAAPPAADGAAIVFQADPRGSSALGAYGDGLGYEGIMPSLAVELDTFRSAPEEPMGEHVGIDRDGSKVSSAAMLTPFALSGGTPFTVWIDYTGRNDRLDVYLAQGQTKPVTVLLTATENLSRLGSAVWLGVTGSTGTQSERHAVRAWHVDVTP